MSSFDRPIALDDSDSLCSSDEDVALVAPRQPSPVKVAKRETSSAVHASPIAGSSKAMPLRPGRMCDSIDSVDELVQTTFAALSPPRRAVLNRADADGGILSWMCGSRSRVCAGVEVVRAEFDWKDSGWCADPPSTSADRYRCISSCDLEHAHEDGGQWPRPKPRARVRPQPSSADRMDVDGEDASDEYEAPDADGAADGSGSESTEDEASEDGEPARKRRRGSANMPRKMAPPPVLAHPADLSAGLAFPTKEALLAALATHFVDGSPHQLSERTFWDSPAEEDRRRFGCSERQTGGGRGVYLGCQFRVIAGKYKDGRWCAGA